MLGTRDSKLEYDFSMEKKKKKKMGVGTELPGVFFTDKEISHYQIVLRLKNQWSVDRVLVFSRLLFRHQTTN